MFVVVAVEPATSLADFRLGCFVAFITVNDSGSPENLPGDQEPPGMRLDNLEAPVAGIDSLPFQPVMPRQLPLDLTLVERSVNAGGWLEIER